MPGLIILVAALYVAYCLYRPMAPFQSRREAALYGIPAVAAAALVFAMLSPPPDEDAGHAETVAPAARQPVFPPPPTPEELARQQEEALSQRRINKIRGIEEERLDAQRKEAARASAPKAE